MRTNEDLVRGLMCAGLDGDAAAHAALLRLLVPLLRDFYRRRLSGADDEVEDLVQETLIAVHTRRATYDRERAFSAWLFAIARYKMVDYFRRVARLRPIEGLEDTLLAEEFDDKTLARLDIDQLLEALPSKQARMIRATRLDGSSVAEAAEANDISESDVKVSVHRGIRALMMRVQRGRA